MADVLVLGAGAAGLAAAVALYRAGLSVKVFEARGCVGGRVRTTGRPGLPVELGAEFVHGEAPYTRQLAADADVALVDVGGTHLWSRKGRLEPMPRFAAQLEHVMVAASRRVRRGHDRSFAEALATARLDGKARALGASFVEGFDAAPAGDISMRALVGGMGGAETMGRVLGGYDQLTERLASLLPHGAMQLGRTAVSVQWKRGDVRVAARPSAGGPLERTQVKRLVIALPLAVLQSNDVRFEPALSAKSAPLARLGTGDVMRLVLQFRDAPWLGASSLRADARDAARKIAFLHAADAPVLVWWTAYPLDAPLLTAWTGGPRARKLLALGEKEIVEVAMNSLAQLLGSSRRAVQAGLERWFFHDWTADPFARGAYSYPRVGAANAARKLARPIEATLFFAGEATTPPPDNGTVEGALASGERAAREVLRSLGGAGHPLRRKVLAPARAKTA